MVLEVDGPEEAGEVASVVQTGGQHVRLTAGRWLHGERHSGHPAKCTAVPERVRSASRWKCERLPAWRGVAKMVVAKRKHEALSVCPKKRAKRAPSVPEPNAKKGSEEYSILLLVSQVPPSPTAQGGVGQAECPHSAPSLGQLFTHRKNTSSLGRALGRYSTSMEKVVLSAAGHRDMDDRYLVLLCPSQPAQCAA